MIQIGNKILSDDRTFVIAEAGSNHNRNLDMAYKLIDAAVAAGSDAVKFQTFTADKIAAEGEIKIGDLRKEFGVNSLQELYKKVELPREWHTFLKNYCDERGIIFLSTPFDYEAVDQLEDVGVAAYKIASFEMVDLPFLKYIAQKGKPLIVSTGMASLGEVEEAIQAIKEEGNDQIILLHCGISYPMPENQVNLKAMQTMKQAFNVLTGYSDHTLGIAIPIGAAALGASVIEKHFTLDRTLEGPDHKFALEPDELKMMVEGIRAMNQALGDGVKRMVECEEIHRKRGRRSIFARENIKKGEIITPEKLITLRPGTGLSPKYLDILIGREAKCEILKHSPITWDKV